MTHPIPVLVATDTPGIDIVVESALWESLPTARDIVRSAIAAAAEIESDPGDVVVLLCDDPTIRALNAQWRGLDKPTNVLSFPAAPSSGATADPHLGDIAIAYETIRREAEAEAKPVLHHLAHLAIHGYLHLLGFDHESEQEAEEMEALEVRILNSLSIPNPYADRPFTD